MILFPYAKINLGLDILRKRPDGYHDLATLFLPTDWCDILELLAGTHITETTLTVTGNRVDCPPEKNLVMKAYRAMQQLYDLPPVEIHLQKVIPDGAGLGGGSADAAFTIKGLNELFSLGLSPEELSAIAAGIGADCPYFIYGGAMMASDTGTVLTPFDIDSVDAPLRDCTLVIVKPSVSMPTAQAYAGVTPCEPDVELAERLRIPVSEWQAAIVNDFETSVFKALPQVKDIKTRLTDMGAIYASMSGSGTAVYALFNEEMPRDILAEQVRDAFKGCAIHVGKVSF